MTTPQRDIDTALKIEKEVPPHLKELYLECLNQFPMSKRKEEKDLRDGCILTHHVYLQAIQHESGQQNRS